MANGDRLLDCWAIYERPKEYPDGFMARRFVMTNGQAIPTGDVITASTLDMLREKAIAMGRSCFTRNEEDDPSLIETWI